MNEPMEMEKEKEKKYLEEWRIAKLWSQAQLAKKAGLNQAAISRIESGQLKTGRLSSIKKIAEALGVKPEQVVEFEPFVTPKKSTALTNLISCNEHVSVLPT